jgi:hypothetical protein
VFLRKGIFPFFGGAWKHINKNSLMEIEKRWNSSSFGNGKIFGARRMG